METTRIPVDFDIGPAKKSVEELKRSLKDLSKPIAAPEWMKQQPQERSHTMGTTFTPTSTAAEGSKAGQTRLDPAAQQTQRQYAQNVRDTTDIVRQQRTSQREETLARAESRRSMARRTSEGPTADGTTRKTMTDVALQVSRQMQSAGGMGGPLGSVLSTLLRGGPLGGAIGAVIGGAMAVSGAQAGVAQEKYGLSAAIPTGQVHDAMQKVLSSLTSAASDYFKSHGDAVKIAEGLGSSGVNPSDIVGQTRNILAEQSLNPLVNKDSLQQLVGQMSTQGGTSVEDTGKTLDLLNKAFSSGDIGINQMTQSLLDFAQVSGGMGLGFSGAKQLMGITKELGPNMGAGHSAGQVIAPMANANGANLAILANMAGVSQDQALAMQEGNQGGLSAFTDKLAKNMWAQTSGSQAERETQFMQLNQTLSNPFALSNLPAKTRDQTIQNLVKGQAKADEQQIGQQAGAVSTKDLRTRGGQAASDQAGYWDKLSTGIQNGWENLFNQPSGKNPNLEALTSGSGFGTIPYGDLPHALGQVGNAIGGASDASGGAMGLGAFKGLAGDILGGIFSPGAAHAASSDTAPTQANIEKTRKNTDVMAQWFQQHPGATAGDFLVSQITPPGWTPGTGKPAPSKPAPGKPVPGKPGSGTPAPGKPASATVNGTAVPADVLAGDIAATGGNKDLLKLVLQDQMQESGFRRDVINGSTKSSAGAIGIGQFMPASVTTVEDTKGSPFYGKTFDPTNAGQAAKAQVWFMEAIKGLKLNDKSTWSSALNNYYGSSAPYGASNQSYAQQVQSINVTITDATTNGVHAKVNPSRKPAGSESSTMRGHIRGGNGPRVS